MDSTARQGKLSWADLRDATEHRFVQYPPSRLRHPQEEDAEFHNIHKSSKHTPALPLYSFQEAQASFEYFKLVEVGESKQLCAQLSFRCVRAAHILGSCMVEVTFETDGVSRKLLFTGDLGRVTNRGIAPGKVVHSGPKKGETADLLAMESTTETAAIQAPMCVPRWPRSSRRPSSVEEP